MSDANLSRISSSDDPRFEELYEIYRQSITPREQKGKRELLQATGNPDYFLFAADSGGRVAGFSICYAPAAEEFCLLEYMAVSSNSRSQGIGSVLFRESIENVWKLQAPMPVLLEVDSASEKTTDQAIRRRRQEFYRRLGCRRIVNLEYALPLPGQGPPPEMDLLVYQPPGLPKISRQQLERWLRAIYERVYKQSPQDPRIAKMLKNVTDPVELV